MKKPEAKKSHTTVPLNKVFPKYTCHPQHFTDERKWKAVGWNLS
jgi:hypothetical protein